MHTRDAYKVDAFTSEAFTGNAAGVVPQADGLTDAQMQAIAREMNVSETAFVLTPTPQSGARFRLRYFTPHTEVPLCGHATIATFHLLKELGRLPAPVRFEIETRAGTLPVEVRAQGPEIFLSSDTLVARESPLDAGRVADLLGAPRDAVSDGDARLLVVNGKLFVPLSGLKAMEGLRPDFPAIARACKDNGMQGIAPVTLETFSPQARTHIRYFAPAVGIPEDPVTGTAHMALAGYLARTRRLDLSAGRARFTGEQGHFMGRPGIVTVEAEGAPDDLRVRVGGRAVTTLAGMMRVPPA